MNIFNKTYHELMEATRRDFLKQAASAAIAIPAANTMQPAAAVPVAINMHAYDIGDSTDIYTLQSTIAQYFNDSNLSREQIIQRANELRSKFANGKFSNKTLKQLIATSETAMEAFIDQYSKALQREIAQLNSSIPMKTIQSAINIHEEDDESMYHLFYELQGQFMRNENTDLFNYLMPNEVRQDENQIMSAAQAVGKNIFKSREHVMQMFNNMPQIKRDARQIIKQIEEQHPQYNGEPQYSPMDYKGGWQHDADYQSLSMGESFSAAKK